MATNDQILAKIGSLETVLCKRLDKVEESVVTIDVAIRGNSKPGIKTRLKVLETRFKSVDWISKIVAGAVVLDIISRVSAALK